jgi:hypothetical protein
LLLATANEGASQPRTGSFGNRAVDMASNFPFHLPPPLVRWTPIHDGRLLRASPDAAILRFATANATAEIFYRFARGGSMHLRRRSLDLHGIYLALIPVFLEASRIMLLEYSVFGLTFRLSYWHTQDYLGTVLGPTGHLELWAIAAMSLLMTYCRF